MYLTKRCTLILEALMHACNYVTVEELMEKLGVSKRTIYYDLKKIDGWLKEADLPPVGHIRSMGFYLDEKAKQAIPALLKKMREYEYEYSAEEREAWIAVALLTQNRSFFLEDLMQLTRVSRNTTIEDLRKMKMRLVKYHLSLTFDRKKGYLLSGKENDIRRAIAYYLLNVIAKHGYRHLSSQIQWMLNEEVFVPKADKHKQTKQPIQIIYEIVAASEKLLGYQFADEELMGLSVLIQLFLCRIKRGAVISVGETEEEVLQETKEYVAAQAIADEIQKQLQVQIPDSEVLYLTIHLLGAKVQVVYSEDEHLAAFEKIILRMVEDFEKFACISFQEKDGLIRNLLLHFKPAYYRIKYGIEINNPLTEIIRTKYHDVFLLTKKVVQPLEEALGKEVNEAEIAYLAMHFLGWMNKGEGSLSAWNRQKLLIVCPNGVGTSRILQKQLEELFPHVEIAGVASVREYEKMKSDVDFIVSTVAIPARDKPVFLVNPILQETEKQMLLKKVESHTPSLSTADRPVSVLLEIIKKHATVHDEERLFSELKEYLSSPVRMFSQELPQPRLRDLITPDRIQVVERCSHWQEAIRLAAQPLLVEGTITEHYIQAMIEQVDKRGPYIFAAPGIAIPHARPEDGVRRLSMSLLKINEPVPFSASPKHQASLLLVLAGIDDRAHLKALTELNQLLSKPEQRQKWIVAKRKDELCQIIENL